MEQRARVKESIGIIRLKLSRILQELDSIKLLCSEIKSLEDTANSVLETEDELLKEIACLKKIICGNN